MILDRAIRSTSSAPPVPLAELWGESRSIVQRVASGALDQHLEALRRVEMRGQRRMSIVRAIDNRARVILRGA